MITTSLFSRNNAADPSLFNDKDGVLPSQGIRAFVKEGIITATEGIEEIFIPLLDS